MASTPGADAATIAALTSTVRTAVGVEGRVQVDAAGSPLWSQTNAGG